MFFYKERKRTQRTECSFEKNGCPTLGEAPFQAPILKNKQQFWMSSLAYETELMIVYKQALLFAKMKLCQNFTGELT